MDKSYEDGVREGRLKALEVDIENHHRKIENHDKRLTAQERITYALLGAIALIEIFPKLEMMFK